MVSCSKESQSKNVLQQRLLILSFFNLLLVSLLGLLLRLFPFLSSSPFDYKNLLHGHSHFAFGGWVMPVLLSLLMKNFPELKACIAYKHWRSIALLILLSAYGMLFSFPVQGYAAISIFFSTISIAAIIYLAIIIRKAIKTLAQRTSFLFIKASLFYACLSAIGPFATGPIVVMGKASSPLYFDAIYFYLHLQYNGFFSFMVLGLFYRLMEQNAFVGDGKTVFALFNYACLPTYALSVLWSQPHLLFNWIGGIGALLQVIGFFYMWQDVVASKRFKKMALVKLSVFAFAIKIGLQLLSAFPFVALLAYHNRNFVIAYLHLVLLGFISLSVFAMTLNRNALSRFGIQAFLFSFITTELLLVLTASSGLLHFDVPYFAQLLLCCSLFFPIGIMLMCFGFFKVECQAIKKHTKESLIVPTLI